ncbi:hypothetical protein PR048_003730 [Dryococelus australis]|uniref:Integrase zinc-binding domain-containing protein n=1 Tax=Dryococelus australis TaxID=614101 RepID=A0ABQ9INV6_9NEOP|nr:hypothetical protein PR048_003730 [Dryococelus australis]
MDVWPEWAQDVIKLIKQCRVCEKYAPKNKRQGSTFWSMGDKSYLLLINAYSKWVDITPMRVHGDPQILVSDNVPFNSIEFLQFVHGKFQCQFSSPKYTQNIGLVEKGMHIAKQLLLGWCVHEWLCDRENKIKQWYNRRAGRKEVAFGKCRNIVERTSKVKNWETGKIVGRHESPRSYWVLNHKGNVVQRTTTDLKPSLNEYNPKLD